MTRVERFKCHCELFQEELGDIGQDLGLGAPAVTDAEDVPAPASEEEVRPSQIILILPPPPPLLFFCILACASYCLPSLMLGQLIFAHA